MTNISTPFLCYKLLLQDYKIQTRKLNFAGVSLFSTQTNIKKIAIIISDKMIVL